MENKINIAELLRDCPQGMELDCTMYDRVTFDEVTTVIGFDDKKRVKIILSTHYSDGTKDEINLTEFGTYTDDETAKCVIFPKGKTTWEGFQRPFKDGDIVFYNDIVAIFKEWGDETLFRTYVTKYLCCDSLIDTNIPLFGKSVRKEIRLATEEEKQKLFDAIKANGYRWNPETKTLEKLVEPKFKVGDRIQSKNFIEERTIKICEEDGYWTTVDTWIGISDQDDWELIPNKFDINTLVPFESKVLVRNDESQRWLPAFWGYKVVDGFITTFGWCKYCIPYKRNEILFKTNNDCDDFYKTWEK